MSNNDMEPLIEKSKRRGGRSERVVSAVHAATLALLTERGYDHIEIPEIAERAQVNKTSIYRRWPNKMALVLDVALNQINEAVPILQTGSLQGDLVALLTHLATLLATPFARRLLGALITVDENTEGFQQARAAFWRTRFAAGGAIVERAMAQGELPAGTQAQQLLEQAVAPLFYRRLITGEAILDEDMQRWAKQTCYVFGAKTAVTDSEA